MLVPSPLPAEELYWAGQPADAHRLATVSRDTASGEELVRLLIVEGMAAFELGDIVASFAALRLAVDAADGCGVPALQFRAIFALFSRESQFLAPDESLASLSRLRALASRLGDATSLASLHVVVARLDASRGHCISARRHLDLARRLLRQCHAPSLVTTLELIDSGLEIHGGSLERAMRSARRGLELSSTNRLVVPLAGCATNLGSLLLCAGDFPQAREHLDRAIALSAQLHTVRLSATDALAHLALAENDLPRCHEHLSECARIIRAARSPARSWYDLANQVTWTFYYERLGDWTRVVELADAAEDDVARRRFKTLRTSLLCAKARALGHLGRPKDAADVLKTALRVCPRASAEALIILEASKAVCASLAGEPGANELFDRAMAACRAVGHRYHGIWIDACRDQVRRVSAAAPSPATGISTVAASSLLLTDVATALGAGHSVDLLAHHAVSILRSSGIGSRIEVDCEAGVDVARETGAAWDLEPDGTSCMHIRGSDRRVSVRIRDVDGVEAISLLKGVVDVVQMAISRAADGESEDGDQPLWPSARNHGDDPVFVSPPMIELLRIASRFASTDLPVLITGETGTGKEIVARYLHESGRFKAGAFVPFNCAAISRDLVESQLFGHRRGAFTGAAEAASGVIRAAERGTLFLDEIGDLDVAIQPKLLRFLESGEIHPVGDPRPSKTCVRVVAATNADLERLAGAGRFRRDLLYRLSVATIHLPPLRARKDEIPVLASLFLTRYAREYRRSNLRLSDDFMAALLLHDWPGNIRELNSEIRRAVALAGDGDVLTVADLAPAIASLWADRSDAAAGHGPSIEVHLNQSLASATAALEEKFIEHALHSAGGRVADAAEMLGLSRKGLFLKRRRYGLAHPARRLGGIV